ncbi:MAG TPA: PKD domain-containing protein [Phaeodactylibacter sp.]|nr:PKD domain-containing protein [Phaeodactylibacter sp.]
MIMKPFVKNSLFIFSILLLVSCGRPYAEFSFVEKEREAPVEVAFENKSKKAESYHWDFGDGNTSEEATPVHKYNSSGNFEVTLTAKKGRKKSTKKKRLVVNAPIQCLVEIETNYGTMTALLYNETPLHRDNFLKLVEKGFYDDLLFHRVIHGFMIQGGDPESRNAPASKRLGSGGPGYQIPAELVDSLVHIKGALAAARTNNPEKKSSGSQFYIVQGRPISKKQLDLIEAKKDLHYTEEQRRIYTTLGGTPHLDKEYTVFGIIIDGLDVLDEIAATKTGAGDRPVENIKMKIRAIK